MVSSKSLFAFFALFLALSSFAFAGNPVARPSTSGKLHVVGTELYDDYVNGDREKNLAEAIAFFNQMAKDPLEFENVMYSFHFYATSHREDYRAKLREVVGSGTPIFITESGLCEASGDGYIRNFWKNFSQRIAVR